LINLVGIVLLGPWLLRVAFGADFTLSGGVLALMGVSVGLFLTAVVLGQGVLALGDHRWLSAGWLLGLVGLAAGVGLASDPILRATLGLLVGSACVMASFMVMLWWALRRWQAIDLRGSALPDASAAG
jgi:O-antigen/teichoic acid export membrane protein